MIKKSLLLGTAVSSALLFAAAARAQSNTDEVTPIQGISKTTGTGINGTIAQAAAAKIPLTSQYSASHISKSEIEQEAPTATFDSILNTEPSINAQQAGPLGVQQVVTFRAFDSAQFTQTFDGIALNDIFNAGASNEASVKNNVLITGQEIAAVNLYRGINNPANNSYDSLAGTIDYVPVTPSDTRGGQISGNAGSFNTLGYSAQFNTGKIDGFSNVIEFSHESTSGWLENDKDSENNFYDAFNQDTGPTGKIYGNFTYNENNGEEAYDIPSPLIQKFGPNFQYPQNIYNEPLQDTDYLAILGTTQALNDITTLDVKAFFGADNFQRNAFSNPNYQGTGYYIPNKDVSHTDTTFYGYYGQEAGIQPKLTVALPFNTITVGGNYTLGHLHSIEFYSNADPTPQILPYTAKGGNDIWDEHDVRTEYSVYIQDEIDLLDDKLKITPGVKYLYANTKDHDDLGYDYDNAGSVSGTAHYISPTAGLSYEFLPDTVLYGAYGQNIEFPTIDAFYGSVNPEEANGNYYNGVEPVHLEPEHVTDYEAGLRYSNKPIGFNGAFGVYLENFDDTFIDSVDPVTNVDIESNGGKSTYKGLELQAAEDFGHPHLNGTDLGDFTGLFNYSYNVAVFDSSFTVSTVGENNSASSTTVNKGSQVALVPRDIVNFELDWSQNGWGAGADARYVTAQYLDELSGVAGNLKEPAYFTLDLNVSKTIPLVHMGIAKSVKFQFNIDNALDRRYDAYAYEETYSTPTGAPSIYNAPAGKKVPYASIEEAAPQAFYGSVTISF
jgi:outer membrane receptor protein involved in Fe transport